jgi:MFS family permease
MAVSNVALFGAAFLTPVFVGKITKSLGWQWSFYFVAIFLAASLPFMIVFVPETAYRRPDYLNTDFKHKRDQAESTNSDIQSSYNPNEESKAFVPGAGECGTSRTEVTAETVPEKDSLLQSMRLFNGRKTDENFFKLLLRPFPLFFFHPGIMWVCKAGPFLISGR